MRHLFEYENYIEYIKDYYKDQKAKSKHFSYQMFSNKSGFRRRETIVNVINGKQHLGNCRIFDVAKAMKLNDEETLYFETLVYYNKSGTTWGTPINCSLGTSVAPLSNHQQQIKVIPNPFSDYTTISITDFNQADELSFILFDITGIELMFFEITQEVFELQKDNQL